MSGKCVDRIFHDSKTCPSTSNSIQVFLNEDGTFTGYCFSPGCKSKVIKNPYEGGEAPRVEDFVTKTPEEIAEEINVLKTSVCVPTAYRSIPVELWEQYKVRMVYSEYDGKTPLGIAHPFSSDNATKLGGYKIKLLERDERGKRIQWFVTSDYDSLDPYGWIIAKASGAKSLYITEGEEDAISLLHIFKHLNKKTEYEDFEYACISLKNGANSVMETIAPRLEEINRLFDEVVLVFDNDEAGQHAVVEAKKLLPEAKVATLPLKDANKCLEAGKIKAARDAVLFRAKRSMTSEVKRFSQVIGDALKPVEMGKSFPWPDVTKAFFGQRKPSVIGFGGGTGIGKTTSAHEVMAWNARKHGWKTFAAMMEETNEETLRYVCAKVDSVPYNEPDLKYDEEQLKRTSANLDPYIYLWDNDNNTSPHETWEAMKEVIRKIGSTIDVFTLDNMTTLSEGLSTSDKNEFIGKVAKEAGDLAAKFDLVVYLYSHLNPPAKGSRAHENGGVVHESQFTGSRGIQRYCTHIMGYERNKYAIDPTVCFLTGVKVRKAGKTFRAKCKYNPETDRLVQQNWPDSKYLDDKIEMNPRKQ